MAIVINGSIGEIVTKPLHTSIYSKAFVFAFIVLASWATKANGENSLVFYKAVAPSQTDEVFTHITLKDSQGYYWLGTDDGLKRYDGKNLIGIYSGPNEPLFNKSIGSMEIHKQQLWIASNSGLYNMDLDRYQLTEVTALVGKSIISLDIDNDGDVWVGTLKSGLYRKKDNAKTFEHITLNQNEIVAKRFDLPRRIAVMPDGNVWLGTDKGLVPYNDKSKLLLSSENYPDTWSNDLKKLSKQPINDVIGTVNGTLVVSSGGHIYEFNRDYSLLHKLSPSCEGVIFCKIIHLKEDSAGGLWGVWASTALLHITPDRQTSSKHIVAVEGNKPHAVVNFQITESGELTVTSLNMRIFGSHIKRGAGSSTLLSKVDPRLSEFMPEYSFTDHQGKLWMSSQDWLLSYDPDTSLVESYKLPFLIMNFVVDQSGTAWLTPQRGGFLLYRFWPSTGQYDQPVDGQFLLPIYSKTDGLWLLDGDLKLAKVNTKTLEIQQYTGSECLGLLPQVVPRVVDNDLLAWSAGRTLCKYDRLANTFKYSEPIANKLITPNIRLYQHKNAYWVFQPQAEKITMSTSAAQPKMHSEIIESLDGVSVHGNPIFHNDELWFLNKRRNRLYRVSTDTLKTQFFDLSEGIPRRSKSRLVGLAKSRFLVIAEPGRIVSLDTSNLAAAAPNRALKVHSISIFHEEGGKRESYGGVRNIDLKYKEFSIELVFGNTRSKASVIDAVYYRLKGSNDTWIKTKRDYVRFSSLSPGSYIFQIKSSPNSNDVVSTTISVEAPPWRRWWAYALYLSIALAILTYIIYLRVSHHRRLYSLANFDPLTELPNRHYVTTHIYNLIQKETNFALLFIDLDRFKTVNDSLGHKVGDQLLISIADRLSSCLTDGEVISRLGGDEFLVVTNDRQQHGDLAPSATAKRLLATVNQAIELENKRLYVSLSIGIALCPEDSNETTHLLSCADAAMYSSKARGGNCFSYYTAKLGRESLDALNLESDLYRGMKHQEFLPHYQAKINMTTGACVGYEVLARWQSPNKGMVLPDDFISAAERTGVIVEISWQLMHEVCGQVKQWKDAGSELPVAVNVSPQQLALIDFSERMSEIIQSYDIDPTLIEFEVTEGMLLIDKENSIRQLGLLRQRGHKIYVDDFGTGYSSLSYLKDLPIDALKIDQSFIKDALTDINSNNIVTTIIELARKMNLELVAEGVEDRETAEYLLTLGCNISQGYYHSKALPSHEINHRSMDTAKRA